MRRSLFFAGSYLIALAAQPVQAAAPEFIIFTADIDDLAVPVEPYVPPQAAGTVHFGGPLVASVSNIDVLSGKLHADDSEITIMRMSMPVNPALENVLFVARRDPAGKLVARWWQGPKGGQCLPRNVVQEMHLEDVVHSLYAAGQLHCPSN